MNNDWWKSTRIYQVTLSSFFDGNNDGIGDLLGLTEKLEYIKDLGMDSIWISPHYASPMDDNGYDVSDFYSVNPNYGTIDDFKNLIQKAHSLDIKIITDLVLNHTSDEHEWFQIACDPTHKDYSKYHDYYIWQKPKYDKDNNRLLPTKWLSWFGGPTWDYIEANDEYYLHIFSKKMPDLNWRNPKLRLAMARVIQYWIDLGVDGFRVDAANHLEKDWTFPDGYPGYEYFSSLPKHHEYIHTIAKDLFIPNHVLTIGESGGATKEEALKYVSYDSQEFNLLIHFGHVWADIMDSGNIFTGKWSQGDLRVADIKTSYSQWYNMLNNKGWNVIYWHNHDHPRIVSHYGNDREFREISAKMLAIVLYFMPGTSITYQGEEIGMTNLLYKDISEFRDVEVFTEYQNFIQRGASPSQALKVIQARSRDNARSPMQWSSNLFAGFSKVKPWMNVNYNYEDINVEKDLSNTDSIINTYKFIMEQRNIDRQNIVFGNIEFLDLNSQENYVYINHGRDKDYLVIGNFKAYTISVNLAGIDISNFQYFYSNSTPRDVMETFELKAYEAYVFIKEKE